ADEVPFWIGDPTRENDRGLALCSSDDRLADVQAEVVVVTLHDEIRTAQHAGRWIDGRPRAVNLVSLTFRDGQGQQLWQRLSPSGEQFVDVASCGIRTAKVTVHDLAQEHIDSVKRAFRLCGENARIVGELPAIVFEREPIRAPLRVGYDGEA